jgi:peptidoglycan/xylan/chitin deacetylase (PgdA/CDA1 family)
VTTGWTCLLYHDVTNAVAEKRGADWFAVSPQTFAEHLDLIRLLGYRGCSIAAALAAPSARQVAISFDDGDAGQFANAFPALVARGMSATFFVTTSWVGKPGYVTWEQLRAMKSAGMSIQSHTRTHPFLSELDGRALREELAGSKAELDDALGQSTDALGLPGGDRPARRLWHVVRDSGYAVVATSRWGPNPTVARGERPCVLHRCTVRGAPSGDRMARTLAGDSWLGWQRGVREGVLGTIRGTLGPSRYAKWRRAFLDGLGG